MTSRLFVYENRESIVIREDKRNSFYYIYIYIVKQILLKTMEHCLLFLILFFQVLLFFLCSDLGGKEIVSYLQPKCFRPYLWLSSGVVWFSVDSLSFYCFNYL